MAKLGKTIANVIRGEEPVSGMERQRQYMLRSRAIVQERNRNRAKKYRDFISELKKVPCVDCGGQFPACAMDFDHVVGVKKKDVSRLIDSHHSLETVLAEVDKCELVCANCHRVRTENRRIFRG